MKAASFDLTTGLGLADLLRTAGEGSKFLAGGQSLGPMLNLRLVRPTSLIEVARVADLRGATQAEAEVIYGAAVTHAEIEDGAVPDATPGWLPSIAHGIAYRAVRNRGTIGGSLAHADPAADWMVTLTALGAEVLIAGRDGRRRCALPGFMTGPFMTQLLEDEIITGVSVPRRGTSARFGYWKLTRKSGEFAKASAAVLVDGKDVRIAVGALEAPPVLLPEPGRVLANPTLAVDMLSRLMPGRTMNMHAVAVERAIAQATMH